MFKKIILLIIGLFCLLGTLYLFFKFALPKYQSSRLNPPTVDIAATPSADVNISLSPHPTIPPFVFSSNKAVLETQINDLIEQKNNCNQDSDCVPKYFGCPFGCYRYLNNSSDTRLLDQGLVLYNKGGPQCTYKCDTAPSSDQIKCVDSKCIAL